MSRPKIPKPSLCSMSSKRKLVLATAATALVVAAALLGPHNPDGGTQSDESREFASMELELRGGQLFVPGEAMPFDGKLVAKYADGSLRIEIEIRDGRANGSSRGWFENGQQEIEENFVAGVSTGTRTRWHANGTKMSEAKIVGGKIEGTFLKWHDNGRLAARAEMVGGKPEGISEAWDRDGRRTARVELKDGEIVGGHQEDEDV